jgi:tetratricopeptide (TPR) repeat protein
VEEIELKQDFANKLKEASDLFNKDQDACLTAFNNLMEEFPSEQAEILLKRHYVYRKMRRLNESLLDILDVIDINKNSKNYIFEWFCAARIYFDLRDFKESYFYIKKCIDQSLDENDYYYIDTCYIQACFCQYKMGNFDESRYYLSKTENDSIYFWFGEYDHITKPLMEQLLDQAESSGKK